MADDLNIKITGDTSNLDAAIAKVVASLDGLSASAPKATAGLTAHSAAAKEATVAEGELVQEGKGLIEVFEGIAGQGKIVSGVLGAVGVDAGLATEGIARLAEGVGGLSKAVPGLLAVAAGFAAIFAAVAFLKDAAKDAENMQSYMATLGSAVEAQGGNWADAQEGVEKWMNTVASASGILRSELIPALNQLVTIGNSVHDAEIIEQAAVDLSIAKHISLSVATNALVQSEEGHDRQLEKLVPAVVAVDNAHGNYQQKLDAVTSSTEKAVTQNNSLEMAHNRLKVQIEAVSEAAGDLLIPVLTNLTYTFIGALKNGELFGSVMSDWFDELSLKAQAFGNAMAGAFSVFKRDGGASADQHFAAAKSLTQQASSKDAKLSKDSAAYLSAPDAYTQGHKLMDSAVADYKKLSSTLTNPNGDLPQKDKAVKATGAAYDPSKTETSPQDVDALTKAHQALAAVLQDESNAQGALTDKVNASLDSAQASVITQQQAVTAYQLNLQGIVQNTAAVTANKAAVEEARTSELTNYAVYQQATSALNTLQDSLKGKTKLTNDDKEALKDASNWQKEAKTDYETSDKALKDATDTLAKHEAALTKDSAAVQKYISDQQKLASSILDTVESSNQQFATDVATHGKSEAEQQAYYANLYETAKQARQQNLDADGGYNADLVAAENKAYAQMESAASTHYNKDYDAVVEAGNKVTEVTKKNAQDIVDAQLKAQQEASQQLDSFLDNILSKHQSFGTALKSLMQQIADNYIKQFESMLFPSGSGASAGLTSIMGLSGAQSPTQASNDAKALATATENLTKAQVTLTTDFPTLTSGVTGLNTSVQAATTATNNLTNAFQGVGSGGSNGTGMPVNLAGVGGQTVSPTSPFTLDATQSVSAGTITPASTPGLFSAGDADGTGGIASAVAGKGLNISAVGGKLLQGYTIGTTIAGIDGGDSTTGGIGGVLGGLAGVLTKANPIAGLGLDVVSGLIGSLFGPHETAAQQPDINNPTWGQNVTDFLGGPTEEGGTNYTPQSQYYTAAGGTPLDQQMQTWLEQNQNNAAGLTQVQQQLVTQLQGLSGGSATGLLGASQSQGIVTLASGQKISVDDFNTLVSQFQQYGASAINGGTFAVNRTAPDFSTASVGGWTNNPVAAPGSGTRTSPVINIINPTIIGNNVLDLQKQISQATAAALATGFGNQW